MPRRWTKEEENKHRRELQKLYIKKNLPLREVAKLLGISEAATFDRLQRLSIKTVPSKKPKYRNQRLRITVPSARSAQLAEFFGIMLGDGGLSHFQVCVHLGTKEESYAKYVSEIMQHLFDVYPKICLRKTLYKSVYLGSTVLSRWLAREGLVYNKVRSQVDVPVWIFSNQQFMKAFLRGFFDTDGSVYKLRYGIQISFTNKSIPLLKSLHKMLSKLQYTPSRISTSVVYITKRDDVRRFFKEIRPANVKHRNRFSALLEG